MSWCRIFSRKDSVSSFAAATACSNAAVFSYWAVMAELCVDGRVIDGRSLFLRLLKEQDVPHHLVKDETLKLRPLFHLVCRRDPNLRVVRERRYLRVQLCAGNRGLPAMNGGYRRGGILCGIVLAWLQEGISA